MFFFFFFNDTATTEIYTLSLHDALPISGGSCARVRQKTDGQFPVTQRCAATRLPPCSKEQTGDRLAGPTDRKSTRLNSSHSQISYAVFCLKKKKKIYTSHPRLASDSTST